MGEDCLVLGRLMYTLGIVMYAAANIPVCHERERGGREVDLMGEDCLVLGRLMYTLGIVMYAAANIPVCHERERGGGEGEGEKIV